LIRCGRLLWSFSIAVNQRSISDSRAVSVFSPTARPVTSPTKRPSLRTANAEVTSVPFGSTRTRAGLACFDSFTSTSAFPPESRSARLDRTSIARRFPWAALAAVGHRPRSRE
jgi:hypothetical protein